MTVYREEQPPTHNIFFWKKGCEICPFVWEALEIEKINAKLPARERIIPIEIRQFGRKHPAVRYYKPEGTPTLVLNGIKYEGGTSVGYFRGVLEAHFENKVLPWFAGEEKVEKGMTKI